MSEFELHSLILLTTQRLTDLFNFWLLCGFGLVVARFVGGGRLRRSVLRVMVSLFLVLTVVMLARLTLNSSRELYYREALVSGGYDPFPMNQAAVAIMGLGGLAVILTGTGAVVYLILWHRTQPSD